MKYAYISREQFLAKCELKPMIGGMDGKSAAKLALFFGPIIWFVLVIVPEWASHLP